MIEDLKDMLDRHDLSSNAIERYIDEHRGHYLAKIYDCIIEQQNELSELINNEY